MINTYGIIVLLLFYLEYFNFILKNLKYYLDLL